MRANVAVGERAQDRIGERVKRNVGVGVAGESAIARNSDAPQGDVITWPKGMHVKARARAHVTERSSLDGFCACKIVRCGELDIAWLTFKYADLHACPLYERRVIGEIVAALRDGALMSF